MRLPALHFQLDDHIPTMARYQNSIISIGVQPHQRPWAGRLPASSSLFEECKLVSGDSEAIRKISDKYIVPEKLVAEYAEHLTQIKLCKEKKKEETEGERMERLNRKYRMALAGYDCTTPTSCRPWGWTSYPCTFPIIRSPSKGRKLKRSQWSKRSLACCFTIQWSVNNLGSPR